eukprot:403369146
MKQTSKLALMMVLFLGSALFLTMSAAQESSTAILFDEATEAKVQEAFEKVAANLTEKEPRFKKERKFKPRPTGNQGKGHSGSHPPPSGSGKPPSGSRPPPSGTSAARRLGDSEQSRQSHRRPRPTEGQRLLSHGKRMMVNNLRHNGE